MIFDCETFHPFLIYTIQDHDRSTPYRPHITVPCTETGVFDIFRSCLLVNPRARTPGDISVSRTNSSNTTSLWDGNDGGGGGYTWTVTFPLSARDAPELGFDGAALEGKGAAGNIVETRMARAPEIQQLSTLAGSEVYGGFSLMFAETETDQLPFNATADEVGWDG